MVLASAGVLLSDYPWLIVEMPLLWPNENPPSRFQGSRINLGQVDPFVISITGSYGKTSTKAILGKILECLEPTFWPPGYQHSYGITRQISSNQNIICRH